MAVKVWRTVKVNHCPHVRQEVTLEAQVVYPSDILPDGPPRVLAYRCSHGLWCNLVDKPSCIWAGTNPFYDPFL